MDVKPRSVPAGRSGSKASRVIKRIATAGKIAVAFSGGADSSLLAYLVKKYAVEKPVFVFVDSEFIASREKKAAKEAAKTLGLELLTVKTELLGDRRISDNPPDRCYYCKKRVIEEIKKLAGPDYTLMDGTNASDLSDERAGEKALKEEGVVSPLLEAGMTKEEIRKELRKPGLPSADKQASACLATRLESGMSITSEKLRRAELAEEVLFKTGLKTFRARLMGEEAVRIEADDEGMLLLSSKKDRIIKDLHRVGLKYITVDLEGYIPSGIREKRWRKKK